MIKKRNNYSDEELEYLNYCKQLVFDVLNVEDLESAKKDRDYLISIQDNLSEVIFNLLWFFIIPYFKTITFHLKMAMFQLQAIKSKISFKKFSLNILKKNIKNF